MTKIGRKWAALDNYERIDVNTLIADGGKYSSPGRCYITREAFEAEQALEEAWHDFQRRVSYVVPPGMTVERIAQLREEFGMPAPKKEAV